ncbi:MAG: TAXI family TRAP transporter solute-binding subunit [Pseudomonadota bacterium]
MAAHAARGDVQRFPIVSPHRRAPRACRAPLRDLVGLRISPADRGFTTATLFDRLMELAGFSAVQLAKGGTRISHLDYAEANRQLRDGHLDVVLSLSGVPNPAYVELVKTLPIWPHRHRRRDRGPTGGPRAGLFSRHHPRGHLSRIAANIATVQIPTS